VCVPSTPSASSHDTLPADGGFVLTAEPLSTQPAPPEPPPPHASRQQDSNRGYQQQYEAADRPGPWPHAQGVNNSQLLQALLHPVVLTFSSKSNITSNQDGALCQQAPPGCVRHNMVLRRLGRIPLLNWTALPLAAAATIQGVLLMAAATSPSSPPTWSLSTSTRLGPLRVLSA
jgi:hypothetical protein